jgi:hypothetical protein
MSEAVLLSGTQIGGPPDLVRRFLAQGARSPYDRVQHETTAKVSGRKTRVLAVVHGYLPDLAAGSERMVQHMLAALPAEEFAVSVLSFNGSQPRYVSEGIPVKVGYSPDEAPDIIITHHGQASRVTLDLANEYPEARIVAVFHNDRYDIDDLVRLNADLNVYNTRWVQCSLNGTGIVIHPPLEMDRHFVVQTGHKVTMVNLQANKGVHTFSDLAARMPDTEFLGVTGTHGEQLMTESHNNVTVWPVEQDMRKVWAQSRVVLMPSAYESFGMVAAEACASGIPVIAHPTPGLVECLGFAGIFVDRDDIPGYERALNLLLTDEKHYAERSDMALVRAAQIVAQTQDELSTFVSHLRKLGGRDA